jgi:hypothetical protein
MEIYKERGRERDRLNFYACKGAHTLLVLTDQRERKKEGERERCRIWLFLFLK